MLLGCISQHPPSASWDLQTIRCRGCARPAPWSGLAREMSHTVSQHRWWQQQHFQERAWEKQPQAPKISRYSKQPSPAPAPSTSQLCCSHETPLNPHFFLMNSSGDKTFELQCQHLMHVQEKSRLLRGFWGPSLPKWVHATRSQAPWTRCLCQNQVPAPENESSLKLWLLPLSKAEGACPLQARGHKTSPRIRQA